jgi:phage major head subunit gpT-like protein
MPIAEATAVLINGIRSDFYDTYLASYQGMQSQLSKMMLLDVPSDKAEEIYGYWQKAPYVRQWIRGEEIQRKAPKSVNWRVKNLDWAVAIPWHENDMNDDLTRSLRAVAQDSGRSFGTLDERVLYQILTSSTDNDLLRTMPIAPDGVGLYSATDGDAADRFGVSGGNIETGSGVATPDALQTDFFDGVERMRRFLDTEGQPMVSPEIMRQGFVVTFNIDNLKVFEQAFEQKLMYSALATYAAAVSALFKDSGISIELMPTPRISDNDWFIFAKGAPRKPIFRQTRQGMREVLETMENSDYARRTKINSLQWDARYGYGLQLPIYTVQINN